MPTGLPCSSTELPNPKAVRATYQQDNDWAGATVERLKGSESRGRLMETAALPPITIKIFSALWNM